MNKYYHIIDEITCSYCNIVVNNNYCKFCKREELISKCKICKETIYELYDDFIPEICSLYILATNVIIKQYRLYRIKKILNKELLTYCHNVQYEICGFCNEIVYLTPYLLYSNLHSKCKLCNKKMKGPKEIISYKLCSVYINSANKIIKKYKHYKIKQIILKTNIGMDIIINNILKYI